jgi:uncharacterized membrane protein
MTESPDETRAKNFCASTSLSRNAPFLDCCWVVIVMIAASLRLLGIRAGLPYIDYVDEGYVLHQTITLLNQRNLDTGWYGYPALPAYLTAAAFSAYSPVYTSIHGHHWRKDLPTKESLHGTGGDKYDLISPPELIVTGRVITAVLSLASVLVIGAIATLVAGRVTGLIAMAFAAVCPAFVSRSANVIVDTFATFFCIVAFYLCLRLRQVSPKNRRAVNGYLL